MEPRVELDLVGMLEGSDKSSTVRLAWDYLRHYELLFATFRRRPINVMEFGVEGGEALNVWEWYFPDAHIIGVDPDPACAALARPRVTIATGSPADAGFMAELCATYPPAIVIDNGSHLAEHILLAFEQVFPLLAPGGLYVIEDLAVHFGANARGWQTAQKRDVVGYFYALADNCLGTRRGLEGRGKYAGLVDAVYFMPGGIVLRKQPRGRVLGRALAAADIYLADHDVGPAGLARFAQYIMRHQGPPEKALEAIEQAIARGGANFNCLVLRGEIHLNMLRRELALADWRRAAALPDAEAADRYRLARLLADQRVNDLALQQAEIALRLAPASERCRALVAHLAAHLAAHPGGLREDMPATTP